MKPKNNSSTKLISEMSCQQPSNQSSQTSANPSLRLTLNYLPASLNKTFGQPWWIRHREKQKAMHALSLALSCTVSGFLIRTTLSEQQNRLQTAYAKSVS